MGLSTREVTGSKDCRRFNLGTGTLSGVVGGNRERERWKEQLVALLATPLLLHLCVCDNCDCQSQHPDSHFRNGHKWLMRVYYFLPGDPSGVALWPTSSQESFSGIFHVTYARKVPLLSAWVGPIDAIVPTVWRKPRECSWERSRHEKCDMPSPPAPDRRDSAH